MLDQQPNWKPVHAIPGTDGSHDHTYIDLFRVQHDSTFAAAFEDCI